MLEFRQVRKSYNHSAPILDIDDLILATGIYWLQGANGTGKTTLIGLSPASNLSWAIRSSMAAANAANPWPTAASSVGPMPNPSTPDSSPARK